MPSSLTEEFLAEIAGTFVGDHIQTQENKHLVVSGYLGQQGNGTWVRVHTTMCMCSWKWRKKSLRAHLCVFNSFCKRSAYQLWLYFSHIQAFCCSGWWAHLFSTPHCCASSFLNPKQPFSCHCNDLLIRNTRIYNNSAKAFKTSACRLTVSPTPIFQYFRKDEWPTNILIKRFNLESFFLVENNSSHEATYLFR